jgi:hypothetical protein
MSDLKKYLNENRDVFDDREPSDGHFERFEERLNRHVAGKKRGRTLKIIRTGAIAASILLLVSVGIWLRNVSVTNAGKVAEQETGEFAEAEAFYREQMNEQVAGILCKLNKADAETRIRLEKDLQEVLENNDIRIDEIRDSRNEDRAIYYLVEHYRINLRALQFINDKLGEYFNC